MRKKKIKERYISYLQRKIRIYKKLTPVVEEYFSGPSVHFHKRCLQEGQKGFLLETHIDMIYAVIATWGMHRIGHSDRTSIKMVDYNTFRQSILDYKKVYKKLSRYRLIDIDEDTFTGLLDEELRKAFINLKVSASKAHLVANSKTLHHILPNLILPIDRKHTKHFFFKTTSVCGTKENQYEYFKAIHLRSKKNIDDNYRFFKNAHVNSETFNSTVPKLLDNLIIAYVKKQEKSPEFVKAFKKYNITQK